MNRCPRFGFTDGEAGPTMPESELPHTFSTEMYVKDPPSFYSPTIYPHR